MDDTAAAGDGAPLVANGPRPQSPFVGSSEPVAASTAGPRSLAAAYWVVLAAGGGALWAAQFGRDGYLLAPWFALAPLVLLLGSPRPGLYGWLHGTVCWLVAIPWIAPTLEVFGQLPKALSWVLLLALCLYLGAYHAVFARLGARLWRPRRRAGDLQRVVAWQALLGLPALWVVLEHVRGWMITGFPWNLAGYAWVDVPGALPLAAWLGPYGISFLVVLANAGVALLVAHRRWRSGLLALLVPFALLPVAGRFAGRDGGEVPIGPGQAVRLVQPNIANLVAYEPLPVARNYQRLQAMSRVACDQPGALVVWPESAGWPWSYPDDPELRNDVQDIVRRGCSLLFNTSSRVPAAGGDEVEIRNTALLVTPGGSEQRYDKRHLVPFGEYVPLAWAFPFMESLARNAGDFSPAGEVRLLDWGRERLGVAICFEITFPEEAAEAVREGATSLVTITNDAWYGDSWAPWQHFRAARFRAAESHRPVLRAAITGVSGMIGAEGKVLAELGPFEEGTLRGLLRGRTGLTPYVRWPLLVPIASFLVLVAALYAERRRARG